MSGLLARAGEQSAVADAVMGWFRARRRLIGAVEFFSRSTHGPLAHPLDGAAEQNQCRWVEYEAFERATLAPNLVTDELLTID